MWDEKVISAKLAMDLSFNHVLEWRKARMTTKPSSSRSGMPNDRAVKNWSPPPHGVLKVNVDASVFPSPISSLLEWLCEIIVVCLLE